MAMSKNPYVYEKMEKEDREDVMHRRAQFLIQKILERADAETRQQQQRRLSSSGAWTRKRVVGIRLRMGRRLRRLRKSVIVHVRVAKDGVCDNLIVHFFKSWRRLFSGGSPRHVSPLPPLFALQV